MDVSENNKGVDPGPVEDRCEVKHQDDPPNPLPPVEPDAAAAPQDSPAGDEASRLEELQADVRNQDDLERDITRQADRLLVEQADERDSKRLDRTQREKEYCSTFVLDE
jgi:DNA excision repair protein ERCC-6